MRGRREKIKGRIDEEWEYTRPRADWRKVDWSEREKNGREHEEVLMHFSSGDQKRH